MKKTYALLICVAVVAALTFWLASRPQPQESQARFAASFYPLAFLLGRLTDEAVYQVTPSGVEPHDYEASPQDILRLREMDLFVYNGAGLDVWAERLQTNFTDARVMSLNMIETLESGGVGLRGVSEEDRHEDEADEEEEHGDIDPHFWLDPIFMGVAVNQLVETVAALEPAEKTRLVKNADALNAELSALDEEYRNGLRACRLNTIVVLHDAFGYLADRYGFKIISISGLSPEQQPSARHLGELASLVREQGIQYVFFETLVSPKLSETLASEAGAQTLVLNPIEGLTSEDRAEGKNYFVLMRENLRHLRLAMDCQ